MFHKFEQGYVALVWQFVRMGRIKEPNTFAVGVITRRFLDILKRDYDVTIESRTIERIKRLSQNLAIIRAKQILYHTVTESLRACASTRVRFPTRSSTWYALRKSLSMR